MSRYFICVDRDSEFGRGRSCFEFQCGMRFSSPVCFGHGSYPASCKWVPGLFLEVKRPGRGVDHPPTSSAEVRKRVELYFYFPSGAS